MNVVQIYDNKRVVLFYEVKKDTNTYNGSQLWNFVHKYAPTNIETRKCFCIWYLHKYQLRVEDTHKVLLNAFSLQNIFRTMKCLHQRKYIYLQNHQLLFSKSLHSRGRLIQMIH